MTKLLTVSEVAEQLGVTEETIRRWLRAGKLDGVLLSRKAGWRVRPESIDVMIDRLAVEGKELAAA
jgi:excisionase family DNA binding protein